ncbi:hypothetical protein M5K25_009889 [Dendrobium thyrsiflorum]|uniref:Uncharacterized protein n=1 Tax=Dendrobium thyrsiflorum TaxID=117978 RepID=A0ABD0VDL3_DENTH
MNSVKTSRRGLWKCGGALERKRWATCDGGEGAAEEVLFSVKRLGPVEDLSRLESSGDLRIAL